MNRILSLAAVFLIALSSVAFAAHGSSNSTSDQKAHKNNRVDHSAASGTSGNRYGY
jgi:putative copper export protein